MVVLADAILMLSDLYNRCRTTDRLVSKAKDEKQAKCSPTSGSESAVRFMMIY